MTKVVFRHTIPRDLKLIEKHISEWAPELAISFVTELRDKCEALAELPERGQIAPSIGNNIRRLVHGNYLILYRFERENDKVFILRIIEGHRDLRKLEIKP